MSAHPKNKPGRAPMRNKLAKLANDPRAFLADSRFTPLRGLHYLLYQRRDDDIAARLEALEPLDARRIAGKFPDIDQPPATTSRPLSQHMAIATFLGQRVRWRRQHQLSSDQTLVGWGFRASGRKAHDFARSLGTSHVLFEDGFLRSVGRRDEEIGLSLDRDGIYYDARSNSRLFDLIARPLSRAETERAQRLQAMWRELSLSKYNDAPDYEGDLPDRFVLVIDQVRNDLSIPSGLADETSFATMLDAALAENPDCDIVLKIHPDSLTDPQKRHFDPDALAGHDRIRVIADPAHVASFVSRCEALYTVTSQVGFEGLMHGKPVHVFGMPFYAGWGLTKDRLEAPAGRGNASLEQLVHAALVDFPRYWNPVVRREIEVEEAMQLVGLNRLLRKALPRQITALNFSPWKRRFLPSFLAGSKVTFTNDPSEVGEGETVLIWGRRAKPVGRDDLDVLRIEDGFLRSSGLGADLVRPLSLVIDEEGIYYDATRPSRLETILETTDYGAEQRARAEALRHRIIAARLTKYNLGGKSWTRPQGRRVLLVVGQVEDDASIAFGSPEIRTNFDLIEAARRDNPDAFLIYKPHPDVVAGLRASDGRAQAIRSLVDVILPHADPVSLLDEVDEVHTMTSLMGFEALMRGIDVVCYGMPFYAGWGLTRDRLDCPRRTRSLTLDELVHGALIDYPRYFSPRAGIFASPEDIVEELADLSQAGPVGRGPIRKVMRPIFTVLKKLAP